MYAPFRADDLRLVVETTEPFVEEGWGGATIRVGGVELTVVERIERSPAGKMDYRWAKKVATEAAAANAT